MYASLEYDANSDSSDPFAFTERSESSASSSSSLLSEELSSYAKLQEINHNLNTRRQ